MKKMFNSPFRQIISKTRIMIVAFLFLILFIFLAYRLYDLQVANHDILYKKAKAKYTAVKQVKSIRGEIYDINGNLLAGNFPCVDIFANPQSIKKDERLFLSDYFSKTLNIPAGKIYKRLSKTNKSGRKKLEVIISKNVSMELTEKIKKEITGRKIKGIIFRDVFKRYYPKDQLLSNTLGFINSTENRNQAVTGIEQACNSILEDIPGGNSVFERSRSGFPLFYGNSCLYENKSGYNIYLTIDECIQEIVEEELDTLVSKWKPKAAYAVMVNPENGSIMAIGQRPTFNPNTRKNMNPESWRNRLIEDGIEPGSIIKPLIVAKALDLDLVTPQSEVYCEYGYWNFNKAPLHDVGHYGNLTVSEIIQKSSNIGVAKISLLMGSRNLYNLLSDYGFGRSVNLPFHNKTRGILKPLKKWDSLSITRFPIGQGLLSSPVQIAEAFTAIANNGKRMRLRIVDKIEDPKTKTTYTTPVKIEKKVLNNKSSIENITKMMTLVTSPGGTGKRAAIPGYEVAGKSGTTQKWINGKYSHSKCIASFIGFVPADSPAFILLVTVDEPEESIYGGIVAAPAFRSIAYKTLKYLDMPADTNRS